MLFLTINECLGIQAARRRAIVDAAAPRSPRSRCAGAARWRALTRGAAAMVRDP